MKKLAQVAFCLTLFSFLVALSTGDPAPQFEAKNQDGKSIHLADFSGKYVLLYFYPKDDTPGCTKEACQFRDHFELMKKHNTVILGISKQAEESHRSFKKQHRLPFDLLVDADGKIAKGFGVGSIPIVGLFRRESILVAPNGKIAKVYRDVDPETHAKQVIADIEATQGGLQ